MDTRLTYQTIRSHFHSRINPLYIFYFIIILAVILYYLNIEATFLWLLLLLIRYNYLFIIIKTALVVTLVSRCILCWAPTPDLKSIRFLILFS